MRFLKLGKGFIYGVDKLVNDDSSVFLFLNIIEADQATINLVLAPGHLTDKIDLLCNFGFIIARSIAILLLVLA